ncbi:MAG: transcription elongation factor NusA [Candidatus Methanofastidiosia archaeon]
MKVPICEVDLRSGILCPGCQAKLKSGEISKLDVEISKLLYKIGQIRNTTFKKAVESKSLIVVIVGEGEIGNFIGKGGKTVKYLRRNLGKKIRIIEDTKDFKKIVGDLLHPARVLGINILYLPDGSERFKIRIPRKDDRKIPTSVKSLRQIISKLTGKDMLIEFE